MNPLFLGLQARSERPATVDRPRAPTEPAPAKPPEDKALRDKAIRDEYSRRTSIYSLISYLPAGVGWMTMMLAGFQNGRRITGSPWTLVGLGLFAVGMFGAIFGDLKLLRCPACDASLTDNQDGPSRSSRGRVMEALSLAACPSCKTRLR